MPDQITPVPEPSTVLPTLLKHVSTSLSFSWYDYILFTTMLGLSSIIGIYFGCFGTKQATADEYLMGSKKMKVIPVAISLVASHVSGITLLAIPADVYRFGAIYWLFVPSCFIVLLATNYVFLPVFFKLQITSTYEYLERRFDNNLRVLASFLFALGIFFYLPVVIYVPALALSAATGVNVHYITPVICGICIFYTTLGGLKAVVWTDTLQFTVTTGAVVTVVAIGIKAAGGLGSIWNKAVEGHRLDLFDFDLDPTKRDSFWIIILGITINWMAASSVHQSCVQKFLAVPSFREAKLAAIYFTFGFCAVSSFCTFTGLIMYARYADCDPFSTGAVAKNDQLLPYYIMDVASHIPGLSGLFIAGICCAALSTLSASLNCLAGTIYEDFILKITGPITNKKLPAFILKMVVIVAGIICTLLVFVIEHLGGILPLVLSLTGITNGPLFGMFVLGTLFPRASSKGTFFGSIFGLLFMSWVCVMTQYHKANGNIVDVPKPLSVDGCSANFSSSTSIPPFFAINGSNDYFEPKALSTWSYNKLNESSINSEETTKYEEIPSYKPFFLFRISFYYTTTLGTTVTILASLFFSYILPNNDPPVHRDLLSPVIYRFIAGEEVVDATKYFTINQALKVVTTNLEMNEKIKK